MKYVKTANVDLDDGIWVYLDGVRYAWEDLEVSWKVKGETYYYDEDEDPDSSYMDAKAFYFDTGDITYRVRIDDFEDLNALYEAIDTM